MIARRLLAVSLLAYATLAQSEVYKWVDDKGKTHYSDHAPAASQGAPRVEIVHGIAKSIQDKIREAAPDGIDIRRIKGSDRNCDISGEAASHALLVDFVERLRVAKIGEARLDSSATTETGSNRARGPERFDLHVFLDEELVEWAKSQP